MAVLKAARRAVRSVEMLVGLKVQRKAGLWVGLLAGLWVDARAAARADQWVA